MNLNVSLVRVNKMELELTDKNKCPKCHTDCLEFQLLSGVLFCENCGFEVN